MSWLKKTFMVEKPIIALLHLRALPGDPLYDGSGIESVTETARRELQALQDGGVDGVLIANEFSLPYEKVVSPVTLASMAYIVGRLRTDLRIPFGVNVVQNPLVSIDFAAAVAADFVRGTYTGAYLSDAGIIDTDVAAAMRRRVALGAKSVKMFFKINPESDAYLTERPIEKITKSVLFHSFPDGLCVSGSSAGSETDSSLIARVKKAAGETPVFANTGVTADNLGEMLREADGAFVGTAFKTGGKFAGNADLDRVRSFMDRVKAFRRTL